VKRKALSCFLTHAGQPHELFDQMVHRTGSKHDV
jgi:hypothetical protein